MQPVSRMMGAEGELDERVGEGGEGTAGEVESNGEAIVLVELVATGLSFSVRAVVPLGHWLVAGVESGGGHCDVCCRPCGSGWWR